MDKDRFNPADFKFDLEQLNYEKALGTLVLNESNEAIEEYLETGNFPKFNKNKSEVTPRPNTTSISSTNEAEASSNNFNFNEYRRRV